MKKILIFLVITLGFSFKHPFYLSVADLKYSSEEKVLHGSVKIFINDLEDALGKIHHQTIDLIHSKNQEKTNEILEHYLKQRLKFKLNKGLQVQYTYLGSECEQEVIWLYMELKNCEKPSFIEVENTILYDFQKNQSNIVHFELDGSKKSLKANYPEKLLLFEF